MMATATIDRMREAFTQDPAEVGRRVRERCEALLKDPEHMAKLFKSYQAALEGKIRIAAEVFPDL